MYYTWTWQAEAEEQNGQIITEEATDNFAYWITPETPGTYNVNCTVSDEKDQSETHVFTIQVRARALEQVDVNSTVLTVEKQGESLLGGAWISTQSEEILYITSKSNQSTSWEGSFETMYVGYSDLTYTLWGSSSANTVITIQSSGAISTLPCTTCVSINDILYTSDILFIGADSGMHRYDPSSLEWSIIKPEKTNAIMLGEYDIYFATTQGVYSFDPLYAPSPGMIPVHTGETWAILEVLGDDKTTQDVESSNSLTLWHVTEDKVCRNGSELVSQPPVVARALDVDIDGNIWCGKYRWDGSDWWTPPDPDNKLADAVIERVVASTEGRIYFLTASGALFRW